MTSDLLFSVLPREGKVPIAHEKQKVHKIDKQGKLKPLSDKEQELKAEEREARQQKQKQKDEGAELESIEVKEENTEQTLADESQTKTGKDKGPKHLDIYV